MTTENLTTLEIHKLEKGQYEKLETLGKLVQNALYLTPEEPIDLDPYLTEEEAAAIYATQKDLTDMSHIYANGTLVNLNGTSYSKKTASFFAPVDNGDKGNFLQSNGENEAPSWIDAQTARGNLGFSGAVTSIISEDLKQDRVLVSSDSGKVIVSNMPVDTLMGLEGKITGAIGTLEASIAGIKSGIEADISTKISALDDKKEDKINILPITKGGTGASSASEALTQLGAIAITQVGSKGGVAPLNASGKISDTYLPSYVPLESNGLISSNYLPSYVDDVLEFANKTNFPATGESGKIYVDTTNKLTYRWGGSEYVEISKSLALGELSTTAYRGDLGKIAYEHSQSLHTVPMGGTGAITFTSGEVLIGNGTGAIQTRAITNNTSAVAVSASTNLITANTLYYHKGNSNITTVGTITSGTWKGTPVGIGYGGTGAISFTGNRILFYDSTNKKLISSGHYISQQKVGINSTSEPTENFYVNGKIHATDTISTRVNFYVKSDETNIWPSLLGASKGTKSLLSAFFYTGATSSNPTLLNYNELCYRLYSPSKTNEETSSPYYTDIRFPKAYDKAGYVTLYLTATSGVGTINKIPYFIENLTEDPASSKNNLLTASNHSIDYDQIAINGALREGVSLYVNGNTTLGNANTDTTTVQGSLIQKNGHIYLDGASTASSTTNTTQIIFRQGAVEHIALSSNGDCFIINPSSSTTANQIALYLGEKSTTNTSVLPSALSAAGFTTTGAISGGSLDISGAATVKTLTISDNAESSHIKFSRNNGINYLHVPTGGSLGVCIGDLSTDNCPFVVKSDMIYPYKTNTIGLGSSSYKWKHLYVGTGGLFSAGTIYPSTANSCNIGTASYIWKYMYGERYYTYDATNKYQGGSFYTANSAATSEQTTYLMLGNNTANGTAGNRTGRMRLYGKSSGYGEIVGPNTTSNYSVYLPTSPQSGTNYMAIGDESGDAFKATLLKPTEANTTGVKGTWVGGMPSTGKVIWREAFTHSELNNDSGDIVFWMSNHGTNEATLNVLIDGCFYQNGQDGFYKVLDENMIVTNYGTQNPENKIANPQAGQVYFKIIS